MVKNISDLTYTIQKTLTTRKFNVNVNHLKSYLGENSPRPWVGPDGDPVPGLNLPIIPENKLLDLSESQVNNDSQNLSGGNDVFAT